jgi:uncharacterized protein YkwD
MLLVLACALAVGIGAPGGAAAKKRVLCPKASAAVRDKQLARLAARDALLCVMNHHRRRHGLAPLAENPRLRAAALDHARWMVLNGQFSHYRSGGPDLVGRLRRVNYIPRSGRWLVGENIGYGRPRSSAPADQVRMWMRSPSHRANILNPTFRAAGLGIWSGTPGNKHGQGATYAVDFGSRR